MSVNESENFIDMFGDTVLFWGISWCHSASPHPGFWGSLFLEFDLLRKSMPDDTSANQERESTSP